MSVSVSSRLHGFEDLDPIPQDDGPDPIVAIDYPEEYVAVMDVFRAVMAIDELSERALSLTSHVIDINAAHYTAWHYRRRCLAALGKDLEPELRFIEQIAEENPKNYQIWYHRRVVVERHGDASHELPFVSRVLEDDAKNYHAWSHRQWCLLRFGGGSGNAGASGGDSGTSDGNVSGIASASASGPGKKSSEAASSASAAVSSSLWSGELMYLDGLLADDVRNNSAWNHRWFVVHNCGQQVTDDVVARELAYAFHHVARAVNNESPWNYARGFFSAPASGAGAGVPPRPFARFPVVEERCRALQEAEGGRGCIHRANLLAEVLEQIATEESLNEAIDLLENLRNNLDSTRAKYWERRLVRATKKLDCVVDGPPAAAPGTGTVAAVSSAAASMVAANSG